MAKSKWLSTFRREIVQQSTAIGAAEGGGQVAQGVTKGTACGNEMGKIRFCTNSIMKIVN